MSLKLVYNAGGASRLFGMQKMRSLLSYLGLIVFSGTIAHGVDAADEGLEFFERRIRPLLIQHCMECHSADKEIESGLSLDGRTALLKGGDRGPAVSVDDPKSSLFLLAISYNDADLQMPPDGKLNGKELSLFAEWIKMGAPMPKASTAATMHSEIDFEAGRSHWSFQPLIQNDKITSGQAGIGKIDSIIDQQLQEDGVQSTERASREVLIRRLSLVLRGLPPKWSEVRRFVQDQRVDAYQRLVDRYLATPQYGERWGRHWLDLARYTDETASWLKRTDSAFRYRDWVVNALNTDLPYDEFIRYQLAVDMMPNASTSDLAALGFLGLSPTYWKEPRLDPEVIKVVVAEEWEERIDTIGRTFLGMSLACARCHDHKFDPVTTEDYYSLASILANTRLVEMPLLPREQRERVLGVMHQIEIFEKEQDVLKYASITAEGDAKKKMTDRMAVIKEEIEKLKAGTSGFDAPRVNAVLDSAVTVRQFETFYTALEFDPNGNVDLHVQLRGNPSTKGAPVAKRYLELFSPDKPSFKQGSGRVELSDSMLTDSQWLIARVMVNRQWMHIMGTPIVSTPSDFGFQGALPSNRYLLDHLASELIRSDWSLKSLHRAIVMSDTFCRSSDVIDESRDKDPENIDRWRYSPVRLEIEAWRDAMLSVSGSLDLQLGGPANNLIDTSNNRRTLYGRINRRDLSTVLKLHGFPEATGHSPKREANVSPLQQLFVLNSDFVRGQCELIVDSLNRSLNKDDLIQTLFQTILCRNATDDETLSSVAFVEDSLESGIEERDVWIQFVHALLMTNEFAFVE